jgi:hypothetical protein
VAPTSSCSVSIRRGQPPRPPRPRPTPRDAARPSLKADAPTRTPQDGLRRGGTIDPTGTYETNCGDNEVCQQDAAAFEEARQENLESDDPEVRAAADSYGSPNEANGVTVSFPADGFEGADTAVYPNGLDQDTGGLAVAADVRVAAGTRGDSLVAAVAHEGVHIVDGASFIRSIDVNTGLGVPALSRTVEQSETRAYSVTHRVLKSRPATLGYGTGHWRLGEGVSSRDASRSIRMILTDPKGKYGMVPRTWI